MSEQNDESTPTAPIVPDVRDADTPPTGAEGQGLSRRPSLGERVYGIRSVAAVAVAGLIIGGGAGAAIHAATDDGDRDGRPGFGRGPGGPGGPGFGGPGAGMPGQGMGPGGGGQLPQPPNGVPVPPAGVPGQTQPTTPPTTTPSDDSDSSDNSSS